MAVTIWTSPKVTQVGQTVPTMGQHEYLWDSRLHTEDAPNAEVLPVFGGRACYQSFGDKAGRRSAEEYLGHIIESKHFSVLEHSSVTFYIEGVSRALTHELIRHRHLSFSQLSQRYVSVENDIGIVVPPVYADDPGTWWGEYGEQVQSDYAAMLAELDRMGIKGKQAREAARAILPNCVETKIVVTGNLRAWMEFLDKRDSPHADAEIQRLAKVIRGKLAWIAPHVFKEDD